MPPRSTKQLVAAIDRITARLSIADVDFGTLRPGISRVVKALGQLRPPPAQSEVTAAVEAMIVRAGAAGDDRRVRYLRGWQLGQ